MRAWLLLLFIVSACSFSPTPLQRGQTAQVGCIDNKDQCAAKASAVCPKGYAITQEEAPVGTGIYYTDHTTSLSAKEEMAYSMTVQCK